jgi:hypothetical protein
MRRRRKPEFRIHRQLRIAQRKSRAAGRERFVATSVDFTSALKWQLPSTVGGRDSRRRKKSKNQHEASHEHLAKLLYTVIGSPRTQERFPLVWNLRLKDSQQLIRILISLEACFKPSHSSVVNYFPTRLSGHCRRSAVAGCERTLTRERIRLRVAAIR